MGTYLFQSLCTALDLMDGSLVLQALSGITHTGLAEGCVLVTALGSLGDSSARTCMDEALLVGIS